VILAGKYQLGKQLGEGGMGAVHEATHLGTGRRVAVKTLRGGALFDDAALARFQREARAVGAIATKHIVDVLDSGFDEEAGRHYMVMELLAGEDLAHLGARLGALPVDLSVRIAAQACAGLVKAHEAGVVHRDVKPANVFLATGEGGEVVVKLLDFGIAKTSEALADTSAALTHTGTMIGTPLYMSPEQAKGLRSIDHRTDVWSLGAVLFQMLTGRPPHHQVEHTMGQLIVAIVTAEPPSPRSIAPWIDPAVSAIVERALRLEPEARFPTAQAMLEALRACVAGRTDLRVEDLVAVSPEQRALAPRTVVVTTGETSSAQSIEEAGVASTTWQGTTTPFHAAAAANGRRRALAAIAIGVAAAVGLIAATRGRGPARSPEAAPVTGVAPSAATASAAPQARRVPLAVPSGATIEIDGAPAEVQGGTVVVEGALGSAHTVVVSLAGARVTTSVVVAQEGAFPPRVDAPIASPTSGASATTPASPGAPATPHKAMAAPSPGAPTPAPKPTASTALPAHATTFE
jgi:serine/threonine-protein kinase